VCKINTTTEAQIACPPNDRVLLARTA